MNHRAAGVGRLVRQLPYSGHWLYLFSPLYAAGIQTALPHGSARAAGWTEREATGNLEREIGLHGADMITTYDGLERLSQIRQHCFALCGDHDCCRPLQMPKEIVAQIPGADLSTLPEAVI